MRCTRTRTLQGCDACDASAVTHAHAITVSCISLFVAGAMTGKLVLVLLPALVASAMASGHRTEDWKGRRAELVSHLFGTEGGALPSRSTPDAIEQIATPVEGCLCSARGHCNASDCQWTNNMTKLTWTLESKLPKHSSVQVSTHMYVQIGLHVVAA